MPTCVTLHSYLRSQAAGGRQRYLEDDPNLHYLLGFEGDEVETLPVKTYVRRLWLAFQSSKRMSVPKNFLDPMAETFSKELEACVSDFVKDEDRLAAEIAKDPIVIDRETKKSRSAFLEDAAHTILVTREWGDNLWGSRKYCRSPLANEKRELGDDEPPKWPQDRVLIVIAVRHWMAARLQEKLRNPRQAKNVPRIECVEDPALRQEQVTAAFPNKIRYNSEDVAHVVAQESVDAPEDATQLRSPRKHPMRRTSTRRARPSAHTTDAEQLQSSRDLVNVTDTKYRALSQAGQRKSARRGVTLSSYPSPPVPPSQSSNQRSNDGKPNTILPGVNIYVNDQSLPKRKKGGGVVYAERGKRLRTSLPTLTFDKVVTREPIEGVNAPRHQTSSAPSLELVGMYGSQSDGEAPHKFTPPNEHTTAWDHSKSGCDLGMPGVTRRRTRSSILSQPPPEDSLDMSINIPCNQNGGSWKTYNRTRGHDVRAAAQEADDLDVDFTLWGDPSAGDPDGDSF